MLPISRNPARQQILSRGTRPCNVLATVGEACGDLYSSGRVCGLHGTYEEEATISGSGDHALVSGNGGLHVQDRG